MSFRRLHLLSWHYFFRQVWCSFPYMIAFNVSFHNDTYLIKLNDEEKERKFLHTLYVFIVQGWTTFRGVAKMYPLMMFWKIMGMNSLLLYLGMKKLWIIRCDLSYFYPTLLKIYKKSIWEKEIPSSSMKPVTCNK